MITPIKMKISEVKKFITDNNLPMPVFRPYDSRFRTWNYRKEGSGVTDTYWSWDSVQGIGKGDILYGINGIFLVCDSWNYGASSKGRCEPFSSFDLCVHLFLSVREKVSVMQVSNMLFSMGLQEIEIPTEYYVW